MSNTATAKVLTLPAQLPLPEGYTGQDTIAHRVTPDAGMITRAIATKQILSARVVEVDMASETITVHLGGEFGEITGVMTPTEFDTMRHKAYDGFIGDLVDVILLDLLQGGVVRVSRVKARQLKYEQAVPHLKPGLVVKGVVRLVRPYGALMDLGGVSALLPVDHIDHEFVEHPEDKGIFRGDALDVMITALEQDADGKTRCRVSLKALSDPWKDLAEKVKPGTARLGKVVNVQGPRVFVKLEPSVGVDLLCPSNGTTYEIGKSVRVKIVTVDPVGKRLRGDVVGIVRGS